MWKPFLDRLFRDLLSHDLAELNWQVGLRNALGIVLPLFFGLIFHAIPTAVVMTVGAIVTGFAGMSGTWQKRSRIMLYAIVWVSLTTFLGSVAGAQALLAGGLVVLSGGMAGILAAVSPELALIGTLATNALIIFSGLAIPMADAVPTALKVMAGGLLQLILMLATVPWQPQADGTASLRRLCWQLASYALCPERSVDLRVARALITAENRIGDRAISPQKRWRLATLLRRLDTARSDLVSLHHDENLGEYREILLHHVSQLLKGWSRRLSTDPASSLSLDSLEPLLALDEQLKTEVGPAFARAHHLISTLASIPQAGIDPEAEVSLERWSMPAVQSLVATIRENLSLRRSAFRHSVRIMGTLALGLLVEHLFHLPRGYWVVLTTMVVLKADFFSTIGRGLARVVGTAAGVVAGTLVVVGFHDLVIGILVAMVVFALAMYAIINVNYTVFSMVVSAEIVLLLSFFERVPPFLAMADRLSDTVIGSALALFAFTVFPTWQREEVPKTLGDLVSSEARYLAAILDGTRPALARRDTRVARAAAAASLDHAVNEPAKGLLDRSDALRLMDVLHNLADLLMELEVTDSVTLAAARPMLQPGVERLQQLAEVLYRWPTASPEPAESEMPANPLAGRLERLLGEAEAVLVVAKPMI
ncbi:FUSC family protein [Sulfobacillus harzensis]|uniref:FUSC family protein n=1 Tax=Sulfobacillus harzensis TaxID=2729629 RepID=A0A7Y0L576_9FIRM|nr:FUSC family protein [Sulfobacillus harzensis]NMP22104.1 FUSC family protein [Sulfobacillus harzensis]